MQLVFSDQALPHEMTKSVFLAGPSPRRLNELDWRVEALQALEDRGFDGTVFLPVPSFRFNDQRQDDAAWNYDNQVGWEVAARKMADIILFWVPRVLDTTKDDLGMPGFTTNVELGEDLHSCKLAYGRPDSAPKCRYLDTRVEALGLPVHSTLASLLDDVVARLGAGVVRQGGEAHVPLFIWQSAAFQAWYANLKAAGNRLDDATLHSAVVVGRKHLFSFVMHVKVWVAAEKRAKVNEFVFFRKDISTVVALYREGATTHLALVREFRSTVSNPEGYVYELAGGSALQVGLDPQVNAKQELEEELGLVINDASRFKYVGTRQLAATFCAHRAMAYAVELTSEEFARLQAAADSNQVFGNEADSERTYVEIATLDTVFSLPIDYSMLGMIFEATRVLR